MYATNCWIFASSYVELDRSGYVDVTCALPRGFAQAQIHPFHEVDSLVLVDAPADIRLRLALCGFRRVEPRNVLVEVQKRVFARQFVQHIPADRLLLFRLAEALAPGGREVLDLDRTRDFLVGAEQTPAGEVESGIDFDDGVGAVDYRVDEEVLAGDEENLGVGVLVGLLETL